MPQMSPLYWLMLMFYFIFLMMVMMMFIYFTFLIEPKNYKYSFKKNMLNWSW